MTTAGSPAPTGNQSTVAAATFAEAFALTVAEHGSIPAVRTVDDSLRWTWADVYERVARAAGGLARLGLRAGDTMAILLSNRPEFTVVDLAAVALRATPFSIYQTYTAEMIRYQFEDSAASVVIVEQLYLPVILEARAGMAAPPHVVVIDGVAPAGTIPFSDLGGDGAEFDLGAALLAVRPDDVATLIYTSGTTGPPKGVELTNANVMWLARTSAAIFPQQPGMTGLSWLPAAHLAERGMGHYLPVAFAGTVTTWPEPREIISVLPRVRPDVFLAVPRVWEKLKAGIETMLASQPDEMRRPFDEAIAAGMRAVRLTQRGEPVPDDLARAVAEAEQTQFAPLRQMFGLDRTRYVITGAAPTPLDVLEFFTAIGLPLLEVWGMSESSGLSTSNRPGRARLGTVGEAAPGVEIRIADDGEVLLRCGGVMRGYRNRPDQTRDTIDADGWLATGDVGVLDGDGYLRIVDRKKELIINAAGKNMSPANIESAIKTASPLIGQAVAIGDRRAYNTALVVLDPDFARPWAARHGLGERGFEQLAAEPAAIVAVQDAIDRANASLARVEQIKRFTIIPGDWLPGGDELTPTMKLKRRPISEKYAAQIEAMYR